MIKQKNPGTRRGSFALYGNSEDDIVPQHDDFRGSSTVARAPPEKRSLSFLTKTFFSEIRLTASEIITCGYCEIASQ